MSNNEDSKLRICLLSYCKVLQSDLYYTSGQKFLLAYDLAVESYLKKKIDKKKFRDTIHTILTIHLNTDVFKKATACGLKKCYIHYKELFDSLIKIFNITLSKKQHNAKYTVNDAIEIFMKHYIKVAEMVA